MSFYRVISQYHDYVFTWSGVYCLSSVLVCSFYVSASVPTIFVGLGNHPMNITWLDVVLFIWLPSTLVCSFCVSINICLDFAVSGDHPIHPTVGYFAFSWLFQLFCFSNSLQPSLPSWRTSRGRIPSLLWRSLTMCGHGGTPFLRVGSPVIFPTKSQAKRIPEFLVTLWPGQISKTSLASVWRTLLKLSTPS